MIEVEADFLKYKKLIAKPKAEMSEKKFKEIIDSGEKLSNKLSRLGGLPSLMLTIETKNQQARLMETRISDLSLKMSEETIKFSHWMKGLGKDSLDTKNAKRLFKSIPDLEYSLNYSRKGAKYTLKQNEEKIIMNKDTNLGSAVDDLRELIQTDIKYKIGEKEIKTQAELMNYVYSKRSKERKQAYEQLLTKQKEHIDKFFVIYQSVVKDWTYEAKLRKYDSSISVRNFANEIDGEVIKILMKVVEKNKNIFQKYFKAKAKKMGVKKLDRTDLYAPIEEKETIMNYEDGVKLVLSAFGEFSPSFAKAAKQIIDSKHVDVYPKEGKRNGAFCATLNNKIDPYVMLNYTGKLRDISTLAHELGHGVHSIYASGHYSSVQSANLPLAETASTLAELLVFEKIKKGMLWQKMGDLYATILRQTYFTMFEIEAHEAIKKGITEKELSTMWLNNLKSQFGEAVDVPDMFRHEWSYVGHIFSTPFYCYAYSFGQLLALSLYGKYKKDKGFLKNIEVILKAGGSKNPEQLLKEQGVNIKDEKFWQEGFDIISEWIKKL
jgi:oligoendopeptidase F